MQYKRADRVGDQILREVSRMLHEEIKDPRIGMVTISRVQLTDDLRYARIYYSVYGSETQRSESGEGLRKASGFIRRQLGHHLRLRSVPELAFVLDNSLDHVERINTLIREIHQEEAPSSDPGRFDDLEEGDDREAGGSAVESEEVGEARGV